MTVSEAKLGLEPRWFTGKEWADGIAEMELKREYREEKEDFKRKEVNDGPVSDLQRLRELL